MALKVILSLYILPQRASKTFQEASGQILSEQEILAGVRQALFYPCFAFIFGHSKTASGRECRPQSPQAAERHGG